MRATCIYNLHISISTITTYNRNNFAVFLCTCIYKNVRPSYVWLLCQRRDCSDLSVTREALWGDSQILYWNSMSHTIPALSFHWLFPCPSPPTFLWKYKKWDGGDEIQNYYWSYIKSWGRDISPAPTYYDSALGVGNHTTGTDFRF